MFPAYVNPIGAGIVSSSSIFVVGATVVGATVVAFSVGATVVAGSGVVAFVRVKSFNVYVMCVADENFAFLTAV